MAITRRAPAADAARGHSGFDKRGRVVHSAVRIDNQPTNFARYLLNRIRREFLTPAEVARVVAGEPPELQNLFNFDALRMWLDLDRYHDWPAAQAGSCLMSTLKHHGEAKPPWFDDFRWAQMCDEAERVRPDSSRFGYVRWNGSDHPVQPGEDYETAVKRVAGDILRA